MNKKEHGITLIALVITIIILLILAGVTLTTALGEHGLFQRARDARNQYEGARENEAEVLNGYVDQYDELYEEYISPGPSQTSE